jgi:hypothetical protein
MKTKVVYLIPVFFLALLGCFAWNLTARAAYESAEYRVLEADGPFEIREYPDLMLASTEMRFSSRGNDGSFMRLFRYISGANEADQKVAMTTPVFMEMEGEELPGQMGFVIPKDVAQGVIPEPVASKVKILKRAGGRFAVVRFAGTMDLTTAENEEAKLRTWIESKGFKFHEESEAAGYDPPFTPGPLRRNEVLIRLKEVREGSH